jgi:hypothetical protein
LCILAVSIVCGGQREKLWQEFFSDPSQWWDHRSGKVKLIMISVEFSSSLEKVRIAL